MQCNPIVVNGVLYATTPKLRLIALDAATGKLRWSFDPNGRAQGHGEGAQSRRDLLGERRRPADLFRLAAVSVRARRRDRQAGGRFRRQRAASTCAKAWAAIPKTDHDLGHLARA